MCGKCTILKDVSDTDRWQCGFRCFVKDYWSFTIMKHKTLFRYFIIGNNVCECCLWFECHIFICILSHARIPAVFNAHWRTHNVVMHGKSWCYFFIVPLNYSIQRPESDLPKNRSVFNYRWAGLTCTTVDKG